MHDYVLSARVRTQGSSEIVFILIQFPCHLAKQFDSFPMKVDHHQSFCVLIYRQKMCIAHCTNINIVLTRNITALEIFATVECKNNSFVSNFFFREATFFFVFRRMFLYAFYYASCKCNCGWLSAIGCCCILKQRNSNSRERKKRTKPITWIAHTLNWKERWNHMTKEEDVSSSSKKYRKPFTL